MWLGWRRGDSTEDSNTSQGFRRGGVGAGGLGGGLSLDQCTMFTLFVYFKHKNCGSGSIIQIEVYAYK